MSTNFDKNVEDREIDLSMVSKAVGNFFQNLNTAIFMAIQFVIKHIVILGVLFVIGVVLGIYLDKETKTYTNQIIVQPNFDSTDYLYAKIDLIQSKIEENDTVFLKSIGITKPSLILNIEIKPVVDIYNFVNSNNVNDKDQNFELLKLMSEDGDINKIIENNTTSKNYRFHLISYKTKKNTTKSELVEPIIKYLNQNDFFTKIKQEYIKNSDLKISANELTISQINGILTNFTNKVNDNSQNNKLVYYNDNTQLNDIIETKEKLVHELGYLKIDKINKADIIRETSNSLNTVNKKTINGKFKLILPFALIFIYLFLYFFSKFYRSQKAKNSL